MNVSVITVPQDRNKDRDNFAYKRGDLIIDVHAGVPYVRLVTGETKNEITTMIIVFQRDGVVNYTCASVIFTALDEHIVIRPEEDCFIDVK